MMYHLFVLSVAILQYLNVPAISKQKCKEYDAFRNYDLKSSHQLCAGGEDGECLYYSLVL